METGPRFIVSSDRLEKYEASGITTAPRRLLMVELNVKPQSVALQMYSRRLFVSVYVDTIKFQIPSRSTTQNTITIRNKDKMTSAYATMYYRADINQNATSSNKQ